MARRNAKQLHRVAGLRYRDGKEWEDIAEELDVSTETLTRWRRGEQWADAVDDVLTDMKREALGIAWQRLLTTATSDTGSAAVAAAREILARLEDKSGRHPGLAADEEGTAALLVTTEQLALMKQREAGEDAPGEGDRSG